MSECNCAGPNHGEPLCTCGKSQEAKRLNPDLPIGFIEEALDCDPSDLLPYGRITKRI